MTPCDWCDEDIDGLPYSCNECGHQFCSEHRLPEAHLCNALRSEELEFGEESGSGRSPNSPSEHEYSSANPVTYGAPKDPDPESSPDVSKDGGIRDPPAKKGQLTASGRDTSGNRLGSSFQRVQSEAFILAMRASRAITRLLKLSIPVVLIGILLIAFTPAGLAEHWGSPTAERIDSELEGFGTDVEAILATNGTNTTGPTASPTSGLQGQKTPGPSSDGAEEASTGELRPNGLHHTNPDTGRLNEERIEKLVHKFANDERGERPISYSADLASVARFHSRNMAQHGELFHTSPEGNNVRDRLERFGVDCGYAGENAAYTHLFTRVQTDSGVQVHDSNQDVAKGLVSQWMNSEGHRENLLNSEFSTEGIGVWIIKDGGEYRIYATQVLCE